MLDCLKKIKGLMLPSLKGAYEEHDVASQSGVDFFVKLMDGGDAEPMDTHGNPFPIRKSFHWWLNYLGTIRKANYWKHPELHQNPAANGRKAADIQGEDQLFHHREGLFVPLSQSSPVRRDYGKGVGSTKPERHSYPEGLMPCGDRNPWAGGYTRREDSGNRFHELGEMADKRDRWEKQPSDIRCPSENRPKVRRPVHPRSRHYGRNSSDSDSQESETSGDDQPLPRHREVSEEMFYRLFREMRLPKEVVAPLKFDGGGGISMSKFLGEFERYFSERYQGSDRQCAQLLGDFLLGAAKQAYRAMDGASLKYSRLKPQLLDWYHSSKTNQRHLRENEFENASRSANESLGIYCLRLERLAERAFSGSVREQERHLCRKFWKTSPRSFQRVLADNERSLALVGGHRSLNWQMIKRLAEAEDRQTRWLDEPNREIVEIAHGSLEDEEIVARERVEAMIAHQNKYYDRRPSTTFRGQGAVEGFRRSDKQSGFPATTQRSSTPVMCHWCGKRGHMEEKCWEKSGACIICGSAEHDRKSCPKLDSAALNFHPVCSLCKGPHLGRDCTRHPLN